MIGGISPGWRRMRVWFLKLPVKRAVVWLSLGNLRLPWEDERGVMRTIG
jgi:hypothetical protein